MEETCGFFEEMNTEDCEEVELSATEEEYESIDEFKESTVSDEINGVLQESGIEYDIQEEMQSLQENNPESINGVGNIRVIYVNRSSVQSNSESISGNQVILLDSSQFEVLIDEISSIKQDTVLVQTVSQNDYSVYFQDLQDMTQGCLIVNVMMFALCFGYFVKETIFRGV